MVALKVALPHLSLSRNNSPSRSNSTPPLSARSKSAQTSPTSRPSSADSLKAQAVSSPVIVDVPAQQDKDVTKSGRPGLGAFGAALRRSTSGKVPTVAVGPSTPLDPSSNGPSPPLSRPPSNNTNGLVPLRSQSLKPKSRSQSTDRRALPATAVPALATGSLQHSHSQPPLSRAKHAGIAGKRSPPAVGGQSGASTPSLASGRAPALHNLEESYVSKVSLKLGEAVNKVFLPGGPCDIQFKGRPAPKVPKTIEFADMIVHELQSAQHDTYLLRTLLRSSVSKSLSLFLTRLTTLLLPTEAMGPPPMNAKEADMLSPALKFNLQVVRCAYHVRNALTRAGHGSPAFVRDALRPWADKLGEVMTRVMNPLITSIRVSVSLICGKARIAEAAEALPPHVSAAGTSLGAPAATSHKQGSAPLRTLSTISRPTTPQPVAAQGPTWLRELTGVLEGTVKMISRLECGAESDKWLVSVATHAIWKGMLSLAARRIVDVETVNGGAPSISSASSGGTASTTRTGLFKTAAKRSHSPTGHSPPLHPVSTPLGPVAPIDVAFVRLLGELELLESRLQAFMTALSSQPFVDPASLHTGCADADKCGLCKTGRQFDAESSDDEDESEIAIAGGLAQYAMREAMQALSAMIVVVRASRQADVLREALLLDGFASNSADQTAADTVIKPLTPMALINGEAPSSPPAPPPAQPRLFVCPTLARAVAELPVLILLHLLASRLPTYFRLPHEIWGLDWRSYEKELRTFQAGEEWTTEVAWEMAGEVARCEDEKEVSGERERSRLECLKIAIQRQAGVELAAGPGGQRSGSIAT